MINNKPLPIGLFKQYDSLRKKTNNKKRQAFNYYKNKRRESRVMGRQSSFLKAQTCTDNSMA